MGAAGGQVARVRRWADRGVGHAAEWVRIRAALPEERRLLAQARAGRDVCWPAGAEDEPLVTVRIATYNRGRMVADRALASVLEQTYERLEILVVGDHCDAATEAAVRSVRDPRIRFVNLPTRGLYPEGVTARRRVAGSHPMNAGLFLAPGTWIAPLDDDDAFTPDHVEVLLAHALAGRHEMVYSQADKEVSPGVHATIGAWPLQQGQIAHGSVLYSAGLRFLAHSNTSWKVGLPSDWELWWRMQRLGVRIGYLPQVTFRLFLAATQRAALGEDTEARDDAVS